MKTFEECCHEVAVKHGLGKTLVTGHKAGYFKEASDLRVESLTIELSTYVKSEIDERMESGKLYSAILFKEVEQKINELKK